MIDFIKAQKKEEKLYAVTKQLMKTTYEGLKSKINDNPCNLEVFKIGRITGLYRALKAI